MSDARQTIARISFAGADITKDIAPYLISVSYSDAEEDETDDLQIKLQDRDNIWLTSWLDAALNASASQGQQQAAAQASASATYTVNAKSGLILRAEASKQSARLNAYAFGTEINVTDASGSWYAVEVGGQTGYMWGGYLTKKEDAAAQADANASSGAGVASSGASGGFLIRATFERQNWNDGHGDSLDCGQFELDTVMAQGPPDTITIKATSLPFTQSARQTQKDKAWEAYKLSGIANEIAANAGMAVMFESDTDIQYQRVEQKAESDIFFLSRLCHNAGLSLKVTNNVMVIFDQAKYEAQAAIMTITKGDGTYTKHSLSTEKASVEYASCRVSYTTPEGNLIEGIAKVTDYDPEAKGNQQLEIKAKVADIGEAQLLAAKHLRYHNKFQKKAQFSFPGNPDLVAGVCVQLSGWGPWSGKYIIKEAKHQLMKSSGYTTTVSLRRVLGGY